MGSKTDGDDIPRYNGPDSSPMLNPTGGEARGVHIARDGDGVTGGEQGDDGDDDEDADVTGFSPPATSASTTIPPKRKRQKHKKKKTISAPKQSSPPRVPVSELFPQANYTTGELQEYDSVHTATARTTAEELRYNDRQVVQGSTFLSDYRQAAEVHRQVRYWVQQNVKPGQTLMDIAMGIDDGVRALLGNAGLEPGDSLKAGMGFPTGLSLNHGVAHYTPNPGQRDIVLQQSDVMKVDFGVHINGWIIDSAFTMAFDPMYDNLLAAAKDATNAGIQTAGIDVRICDVSAAIQEAMESYEVDIRGETFPVKAVRSLCAHDIKHYRIHGGKSIPFVKNADQTKMEEGEVFAIETFGTTGRGVLVDDEGIYGYGLSHDAPKQVTLPLVSANRLYKTIKKNFGTLVFCHRYLARLGLERYLAGLNCLERNGIVESYQPLADVKGSYSAQFEHTILLRESCKEVLSRGTDY
ncbi:methionine aminopeptidase 2-like protein [Exophiala viscosa]|uniref:methionine aminopeptidase 2-like protein n=1 Tax=Exophiala viscosa TaxID=2486360 RepID=UPI00219663D7|nr:methionine aminopeptidase 2-like protein [Exophiala viscosa]